jgi:hypothetical protein
LQCEWKYINWEDFTSFNLWFYYFKKEVKTSYGKDSGDDNSSIQNRSPHPSLSVHTIRFKKGNYA